LLSSSVSCYILYMTYDEFIEVSSRIY